MKIIKRTGLTRYGALTVANDTAYALHILEQKAKEKNIVLDILDSRDSLLKNQSQNFSESGREVLIRYSSKNAYSHSVYEKICIVWSLAYPLGFQPYFRHPLPGEGSDIFHFFGIWQPIMERLYTEGSGEYAWSSMWYASMTDIGKIQDSDYLIYLIQGQLHRLGVNCGIVNGKMTDKTKKGLQSLGLYGMDYEKIAVELCSREPINSMVPPSESGYLYLSTVSLDRDIQVNQFGDVGVVNDPNGVKFNVGKGTGKIVIDF